MKHVRDYASFLGISALGLIVLLSTGNALAESKPSRAGWIASMNVRAQAIFDRAVEDAARFASRKSELRHYSNGDESKGRGMRAVIPESVLARHEPRAETKSTLFANDAVDAESKELDNFDLSDAEITLRCRTAISQKLEMVEAEDGRRVTKCEHTYETARAVVRSYRRSEEEARMKFASKNFSCAEDSTQESCLKAGRAAALEAMKAHQAMESTASEGEDRLVQLVGANEVP